MNTTETLPPRPDRREPAIIQQVADILAPRVIEWIGDSDSVTVEEVSRDLVKAMRWESDGYRLARELDDYDPDAALVEILDEAGHLIISAHDKACAAWVATSGIQPPALGDFVHGPKPEQGIGEIVRLFPEGKASVCFPALGHVKEGPGVHGAVIAWELLRPAPTPNDEMP